MKRGDPDEYGQPALWISWSRLYEWSSCQQKSVFHAQGKGDTVKNIRMFIHGTLADRAVRRWLEQDEPQLPGQMNQYVDDLWEQYAENSDEGKVFWRDDPVEDKARVRALAKKVVDNVEPFLFARVLPYEYHPELRFELPMQIPDSKGFARTIVLNGGSDIVVRDPATGRVSVYDLKATENERYVSGGIMAQLIFYQIAMHQLLGTEYEKIRAAFLTPACKTQYHELEIGALDRQHLMTRIINYANFVWDKQEPVCVADNNVCWGCPMKRICPKWADKLVEPKDDGKHRVSLVGTAQQRAQAKVEDK